MNLVDIFFGTIVKVKLEEPILVTLELHDGQEPLSAIVTPRIGPDGGVALDLYGAVEQSSGLSGHSRLYQSANRLDTVIIHLPQNGRVEAIVRSLSMSASLNDGELRTNPAKGSLALKTRELALRDCQLSHARVCIQDFPLFLGDGAMHYVTTPHHTRALGRSEMKTDGWNIVIEENPEPQEGHWDITHTAIITRGDGNDFAVADLNQLLEILTYFLTFVVGVYRTPTVTIGYDSSGQVVWGTMGMFKQSKYADDNWFGRLRGMSLATLFPGFCQCFNGDREGIGNIISLYAESSMIAHMNYAMHKNALKESQSALEGLAALILRRDKEREESASHYIAESIKQMGIGYELAEFPRLLSLWQSKYRKSGDDNTGPTFITRLRNRYTHPTSLGLDVVDYYEAWRLSQRYSELLLLGLFGYKGDYRDRLTSEVTSVPWVTP